MHSLQAGCITACTPLGKIIFSPTITDDLVSRASSQLGEVFAGFTASIIKTVLAVLELFGEATLSIGAIVLACSIFQKVDGLEGACIAFVFVSGVIFEQLSLLFYLVCILLCTRKYTSSDV